MSKTIQLTRGKVAIVDDADYKWLSQYNWVANCIRGRWYAVKFPSVYMHRFVTDAPKDKAVDHVNGDGLDNRRINLRLCTSQENSRNKSISKANKSGYKGVSWYKRYGKWRASIKHIYLTTLGYYDTPEEAAHAYDEAAKKYHGKFANLNFPEGAR